MLICILSFVLLLQSLSYVQSSRCHNISGAYPTVPGLNMVFSEAGMNSYMDRYRLDLEEDVMSLVIPDSGFVADLGIANFQVNFTDIFFDQFSIENVTATLQDPYFSFSANHISASLHFSWEYTQLEWPYIGDQGWGEATLTDLSMAISSSVTLNKTCSVMQCHVQPISLSVGDVSIELHGGASWLYDLIIDAFLDIVEEYLIDPLAVILQPVIEDGLDDMMAKLPSWGSANKESPFPEIFLDSRYASAPQFRDGFVTMGRVSRYQMNNTEGTPWPRDPSPLPPISSDAGLQLYVDQQVFRSQQESYWIAGALDGQLNTTNVSPDWLAFLSTDLLAEIIPEFASRPGEFIKLNFTTNIVPTFQLMPVAAYVHYNTTMDVIIGNDTESSLSLQLGVGMSATPNISQIIFDWGPQTYFSFLNNVYDQRITVSATSEEFSSFELTTDAQQLVSLVLSEMACPYLDWLENEICLEMTTTDMILVPGDDLFTYTIKDTYIAFLINI